MKGETIDDGAIRMAESDNVLTTLEDLPAGREFRVDGETVTLAEGVDFGHKFAVEPLDAGDTVRKYGEVIGTATEPIGAGEWVHTHNVVSARGQPGDGGGDAEADGAGDAEGEP